MFNSLKLFLAEASTVLDGSAEASGSLSDGGATSGNWLSTLSPIIMLVIFAAVFYFLLIRPEKKRKKKAEEQRDAMKVGDTVITIGGITGEIEKIRKDTITIFTGNCSMDIQKWAIRTVEADELTEEEAPAAEEAPAEEAESTEAETKE